MSSFQPAIFDEERKPIGRGTSVLACWPFHLSKGLSYEVRYLTHSLISQQNRLCEKLNEHGYDPQVISEAARNIPLISHMLWRRLAPQDDQGLQGTMLLITHLGQLNTKQRAVLRKPIVRDTLMWRGSRTEGKGYQFGRVFAGDTVPQAGAPASSAAEFFTDNDICRHESQWEDGSVFYRYTGNPVDGDLTTSTAPNGTRLRPFLIDHGLAVPAIDLRLQAPESAEQFNEFCTSKMHKATKNLCDLLGFGEGTSVNIPSSFSFAFTNMKKELITIAWCSHELAKSHDEYESDKLRNDLFLDTMLEAYASPDFDKTLFDKPKAPTWICQGRLKSSQSDSGVFTVSDRTQPFYTRRSARNTFSVSSKVSPIELDCAFGSRSKF